MKYYPKVGDVWRHKNNCKFNAVVTNVSERDEICYITLDGKTHRGERVYFLKKDRKFVDSYSMWQEAVNSKEFNK